jgi:hypothetical protein
VLEAAVAAEETLVLEAPHRLPDSELAHRSVSPPYPSSRRTPGPTVPRDAEVAPQVALMMPYWMAHASGKVDLGFRRDDQLWEAWC